MIGGDVTKRRRRLRGRARVRGVGHRQLRRIPGNGRQVRSRMLHVFEFRAGGISRENVWMDTATVLAQLQEPAGAQP